MCGITGMVFQNGVSRDEMMMGSVRFLFNQLVTETQERGKDATGVISMKRDGSYNLYKSPVEAREITTEDDAWTKIVAEMDSRNASLIAHTRWFTKGSPKNNNNNHPFEVGNIMGVHNGTLTNDDALFKQFGFVRNAEVDSEIIFHLLDKYNSDEVTFEGLKSALEKSFLRGLFAIVFANKNQPNITHIVKQEKPMTLAYWEEAGLVIYNSQEDLIMNAFNTLKLAYRNMFGYEPAMTVTYQDMKDDTYITIDANGQNLDSMLGEVKKIYLLSSTTKGGYYQNGAWVSYAKKDACGTTGTTGISNIRTVTATDSIGRVIEGELDEVTGEIIIYTTAQIAGADDEDVTDDDSVIEACIECNIDLEVDEIHATFNSNNPPKERVCKECYAEAMQSVLG